MNITAKRLTLLRKALVKENVDAFYLTNFDEHSNKFGNNYEMRHTFISGLNCSNAEIIVTAKDAVIWTDSRYLIEAKKVLQAENWTLINYSENHSCLDWLRSNIVAKKRIGFCARLTPFFWYKMLESSLGYSHELVALKKDLVGDIWNKMTSDDEPFFLPRENKPQEKFYFLPSQYIGEATDEKIIKIRKEMANTGVSMIVVSALDEIAWLFNARGTDYKAIRCFDSYCIITPDKVKLYATTINVEAYASENGKREWSIEPIENFYRDLEEEVKHCSQRVLVDITANYDVANSVMPKEKLYYTLTPLCFMKAQKNSEELRHSHEGHLKDSLLLCDFWAWLSHANEAQTDNSSLFDFSTVDNKLCQPPVKLPGKHLTEYQLAQVLEELRKTEQSYLFESFSSIMAFGENAASPHYKPTKESSVLIGKDNVLLLDCGAQYENITTTDVTRTVYLGKNPSRQLMKEYTLVLKAHIHLASLQFPETKWMFISSLPKQILWSHGMNYVHGTGHNVGAGLNVHEYPCNTIPGMALQQAGLSEPSLTEKMFITIEPGYYIAGSRGFRLENCYEVYAADKKLTSYADEVKWLKFRPLTYVPFDRRLIDISYLTDEELVWLDDYHMEVQRKLIDLMNQITRKEGINEARIRTKNWVIRATEPIRKGKGHVCSFADAELPSH